MENNQGNGENGAEHEAEAPAPSPSRAARTSALRAGARPTTHLEIMGRLQRGGYIRSAIVETEYDQPDKPAYTCFLLLSWCQGYRILHINWPARPRQFRDLDRLIGLIRRDFGYRDTIALRLAGGTPGQKMSRFREE